MALRVKILNFKQHQRIQCKKVILVMHILKFVILALSGNIHFGGVGSGPTPVILFTFLYKVLFPIF